MGYTDLSPYGAHGSMNARGVVTVMLSYSDVAAKPELLCALTGLDVRAFEKLSKSFERAYQRHLDQIERNRKQPRRRGRGGGRKSAIATVQDKLLFILVYFRIYPLQVVQGLLFGLSQPQANFWIHRLTPILEQALGERLCLPARRPSDMSAVLVACPDLKFIIDGTERAVQRPKDASRQRQYYSGRKKRHAVKNVLVVEKSSKMVMMLSETAPGSEHDKKIADRAGFVFGEGSHLWADSGFEGYKPEGVMVHCPKKKPPGGVLSAEEVRRNKQISSERVKVEHAICGVKVFRIVKDTYRNRNKGYADAVMLVACGLHNLRCDHPMAA
jgi:hypothetical protein